MKKQFWQPMLVVALQVALIVSALPNVNAQVTATTLDNGMRLIVNESHAVPIVAVDAWVRAGTRRERPDQAGVAHYLEHLLFKGTPTHPDEESVDGSIEDLGGTLDAATSYDWAHFYTEVPASGCTQAISLLADILQHATLKQSAVDEERPIIVDEIDRNNDDPLSSMEDTARGMVYAPGAAYGRPITGSEEQVRAITRDQILQFYNAYYVPNDVTLVVSGDVSSNDILKSVDEEFGGWKRSSTLPEDGASQRSNYQTPAAGQPPVQKSLNQKDADESYIVIAFAAPSVKDQPDAWDMDVLLTMLGQGGNNRLTRDLKNKDHLVNTISADFLTQKDPGILTISASMPTANVNSVETDIVQEIQLLRDQPVSDAELNAAKNALRANYLFDVDTDSGHADSLGFYDSIDGYEYDVDYLSHISSVTADDVERIAKKYLDPASYTLVLQIPPPDVSTVRAVTTRRPQFYLADRLVSK